MQKTEEKVFQLLKENKITLSTAESATGGMIASRLVNVPGISEFFQEGYVTYSNDAKVKMIGADREIIDTFGVVSREVAENMAVSVAKTAGTDAALSVTGVAGPEPSEGKQPGTVYIALADGKDIRVEKLTIDPESREAVRKTACSAVFAMICKSLDIA